MNASFRGKRNRLWVLGLALFLALGAVFFRVEAGSSPECNGVLIAASLKGEAEQAPAKAPFGSLQTCRIVQAYPHDPQAFTQGLVFADGFLYESTGLRGRSTLRKVEPETGKVLKSRSLAGRYFGEGLTLWKSHLIQLTWQSGVGFVYDRETFSKVREFPYAGEGWGITQDGRLLIMSDGTSTLRLLDPETFEEMGALQVRHQGVPVSQINELEFVKGEVLANIWGVDRIARISPATGEVLGWIDLSPLRNALGPVQHVDALNGIAYDAAGDRIFVTGKLWPKLFQIEILPGK